MADLRRVLSALQYPLLPGQTMGRSENTKLTNRPVWLDSPTGGQMTTYSIGFLDKDGNEVLIPTIVGGKRLGPEEAIEHYYRTGEHFGKFENSARGRRASDEMGYLVHKQQEADPLVGLMKSLRF